MDRDADFDPAEVPRIAQRLCAAGIADEAAEYFEAAGDIAASGNELVQACEHYRRAIALKQQNGRRGRSPLRKLTRLLYLEGKNEEALALMPLLEAEDLGFLGLAYWGNAQTADAFEAVTRMTEGNAGAQLQYERLLSGAWLSYEVANMARAAELLERAQRLEVSPSPALKARFLDVRGRLRMSAGCVDEAFGDFRVAIGIAEEGGDELYFAVLGNYADNLQLIGGFHEARLVWKRMMLRSRSVRSGWHVPDTAFNYARCLLALGDLAEAARWVEAGLAARSSCPAVLIRGATAALPVGVLLARADFVDACADESIIDLALRSKEAVRIGATVAAFAQLFISQRRTDEARALLSNGLRALSSADHAYQLLALVAEHGSIEEAQTASRRLHEARHKRGDQLSSAFAAYVDAHLARRGGVRTGTCENAATAAMRFARLGMRYWHARALELSGRARDALCVYRSMHDVYDTGRLERLFSRKKARAADNALTDRQNEIAVLVGAGLSNKEIADRLGISQKTVENLLAVVYARLKISSRAKLIALYATSE